MLVIAFTQIGAIYLSEIPDLHDRRQTRHVHRTFGSGSVISLEQIVVLLISFFPPRG